MKTIFFLLALSWIFPTIVYGQQEEFCTNLAEVNILYRQCANEILLESVEGNCADFLPKVKMTGGGEIKQHEHNPYKFLIVPTGTNCQLEITNLKDSTQTTILSYKVIDPPKHSTWIQINGQPYQAQMEVGKGSKASIQLRPDHEFWLSCPKDARYLLTKIEIYVAQEGSIPQKIGGAINVPFKEGKIEVPIPMSAFSARGNRIYIEFELARVNFLNHEVYAGCSLDNRMVLITK